ncbi:hypothetical protein [Mucilaginibacter sp.]|uniref:hypothetical protein n=1 Tax=Mucilaginibacter sp. TaxID=1882438 RepID=UPI00262C1484|nr:hypothetical protein [Mucilaginibacter sp.]
MDPTNKPRFQKTLKIFFYNVLGIILPFLLSLIPIMILNKTDMIYSFLDQGQFFLFSAGLLTSAILIFSENRSAIKLNFDKFLDFISIWLLIFCSAFFAIIYCLSLIDLPPCYPIAKWFIRSTSLILFIIALISIYRSVYIDSIKVNAKVDVKTKSANEIESLMGKLNT